MIKEEKQKRQKGIAYTYLTIGFPSLIFVCEWVEDMAQKKKRKEKQTKNPKMFTMTINEKGKKKPLNI